MTSQVSNSLEETKKIAKELVAELSGISSNLATVVGLSGNLGSGKTTFIQFLAQELGISEFVTSPTFVIMKTYPTKNKVFKKLIHIDAYRLEKSEEFEVLGLDKILTDPQNLIFIEWPEKVAQALPENTMIIKFEVVGETERKITR